MRGYKELTCIKFADSNFAWGSTTSEYIMLDSGVTIPTNVSTTNALGTSVSDGSGTKTYTFLSPDVFDTVSVLDGTAYGSFRLYAYCGSTGGSGSYVKITSVDITIEAIDSDGNARELFTDTVWTGTHQAGLGEGTEYLGIMYWFNVAKQEIKYNERLKLTIDFDYSAWSPISPPSRSVGITCSPDDKDMTLTLPFIV
jgi:hypothetical protein